MTQRQFRRAFHASRVMLTIILAFFLTAAQKAFLRVAEAQVPAAVTLQPGTAPAAAEPGVTIVNVMGSGFPTGTIPAGNVNVELAPVGSGPVMTGAVLSVVTVIGTTRRIAFQISPTNQVSLPTVYKVSVSGTTSTGVSFASSNTSAVTINPPATIALNPASGTQGQGLSVMITGSFSNFFQGSTVASFGPGISVGGAAPGAAGPVTVNNATSATAQVQIGAGVSTGAATATITTGSEVATAAFTINAAQAAPVITGNPASLTLKAGAAATFTAAASGVPAPTVQWQVSTNGGTTFTNLAGATATTLMFTSALGQSGNQYQAVFTNTVGSATTAAATLTVTGLPTLLQVNPNTGQQGQQSLMVTLTGQFTSFVQGTTMASFGAGVTVVTLTANSATSATAVLNIDPAAAVGVRNVTLTTGTEVVTLTNGFSVQSASGQPASLGILLSDTVVAPGESITVTPEALDSGGNVINDPSLQFNIAIVAAGLTSGNAPVISGTTISFPRLIKKLLNQNPALDPNGLFADTDPTDPNYGKETGGFYSVNVTLVGSALGMASASVAVVPTGTATVTLKAKKYASQLQNVLSEGTTALLNRDLTGVAKTEADINLINGNTDFSAPVLGANNVLAPPNGFVVTVSQLMAAGFVPNADDAQIGAILNNASTQIQQAITRLRQVNPAALTQTDVNDVQTITNNYKTIFQQLKSLQPSAIGVSQQQVLYNTLLRRDLPRLLDAITTLSNGILQQVTPFVIANAARPLLRLGPRAPSCPQLSTLMQPRLQPARYVVNAPSRHSKYQKRGQARLRNAQFIDFFFTTFGILTDLEGTALNNIITLSISLANDILNIEAANLINGASTGSLTIDFVVGSSSLSFICPNFPSSFVEGTGYSTDPQSMEVVLIGCVNASAIASLLTLSPPKDFAAAIRFINDVNSLAEALPNAFNVVALTKPDAVQPGLFDPSALDLTFNNGWPRVNQGDIPCVGLVFVANLDSGAFAATNDDFLGVCG